MYVQHETKWFQLNKEIPNSSNRWQYWDIKKSYRLENLKEGERRRKRTAVEHWTYCPAQTDSYVLPEGLHNGVPRSHWSETAGSPPAPPPPLPQLRFLFCRPSSESEELPVSQLRRRTRISRGGFPRPRLRPFSAPEQSQEWVRAQLVSVSLNVCTLTWFTAVDDGRLCSRWKQRQVRVHVTAFVWL